MGKQRVTNTVEPQKKLEEVPAASSRRVDAMSGTLLRDLLNLMTIRR
jgi:hypothetical protein